MEARTNFTDGTLLRAEWSHEWAVWQARWEANSGVIEDTFKLKDLKGLQCEEEGIEQSKESNEAKSIRVGRVRGQSDSESQEASESSAAIMLNAWTYRMAPHNSLAGEGKRKMFITKQPALYEYISLRNEILEWCIRLLSD